MESVVKSEGKTPHGGVRAEKRYMDDDGNPADRKIATRYEIVEIDEDGHYVHRIQGVVKR